MGGNRRAFKVGSLRVRERELLAGFTVTLPVERPAIGMSRLRPFTRSQIAAFPSSSDRSAVSLALGAPDSAQANPLYYKSTEETQRFEQVIDSCVCLRRPAARCPAC